MTITINSTLILCWLFIIAFETIYCYFSIKKAWKEMKKSEAYAIVMTVYQNMKQSPSFILLEKRIRNPYSYFLIYIIFCIISPILLPSILVSIFKKITGYKSELEKKSEEEIKLQEEAQKKSKEWMANEGVENITEEIIRDSDFENNTTQDNITKS